MHGLWAIWFVFTYWILTVCREHYINWSVNRFNFSKIKMNWNQNCNTIYHYHFGTRENGNTYYYWRTKGTLTFSVEHCWLFSLNSLLFTPRFRIGVVYCRAESPAPAGCWGLVSLILNVTNYISLQPINKPCHHSS